MDLLHLELDGIVLRSRGALTEVDEVRKDEVKVLRERPDLAAPVGSRVGTHAVEHEQIRLAWFVIIADVKRGRRGGNERIVGDILLQMLAGMLVLPAEHGGLLGLGEDGVSSEEEKEDEAHEVEGKEKMGEIEC